MEKKTMDALHVMLCGEIEDIVKKGNLSHETLDVLKDLVETEKNLDKIEHYKNEKEEKEKMNMSMMDMDRGYSQRKYYIDADYDPYAQRNSYRGGYDMYDMSFARGGNMGGNGRIGGNSYMDGNSYMYYDPRYEQSYTAPRPYSRAQSPQEVTEELKQMMNETADPAVKAAISEVMTKMSK